MSNKLRTVKLTERQWDHVLIAVENTVRHFTRSINDGAKNDFDMSGSMRALARNNDIASDIAGQLDWKPSNGEKHLWKMVATAIDTYPDSKEPKTDG